MIGRFARRTPTTLADLAQQYLAQPLPDISGIFTLPQASMPIVEEETVAALGLTPEQLALLYPQDPGSGDDPYRGGGKFGNLDLSRSKTFTKDVYDEELGDFIPTELTAYYNPTLGNYQTFEGKNINPMFSNTGLPTFGLGTLAANMFGLAPKTVGGYVPGSIRGFYDTPRDLFNKNRNIQRQTDQQRADIRRVQRDIDSGKYDGGRDDGPKGPGPSSKGLGSIGSGGTGGRTASDRASSERGRALHG